MAAQYPLTVHVPIRGKLLIRLDGTEALHEVGDFSQDIPVTFTSGPGEVNFQFEEKFWEGAVKNRGVGGATPRATASIVEEVLLRDLQAFPSDLASRIVEALEKEGRLSA